MITVPYIETSFELCALYLDNIGAFWVRLLKFDPDDAECAKVQFLVIDGAHRRWVSMKLLVEMMWSRFLQPCMSYGDLVCFNAVRMYVGMVPRAWHLICSCVW